MYPRPLVPGEADVPNLALLLRQLRGLDAAARREDHVGIGVVDALMEHPQIDTVSSEAPQTVL